MELQGTYNFPNRGKVINPKIALMTTKIDSLDFVKNVFDIWIRVHNTGTDFDYLLENISVENLQFNGVNSLMTIIANYLETFKIEENERN
jgi:hypothetical protein